MRGKDGGANGEASETLERKTRQQRLPGPRRQQQRQLGDDENLKTKKCQVILMGTLRKEKVTSHLHVNESMLTLFNRYLTVLFLSFAKLNKYKRERPSKKNNKY